MSDEDPLAADLAERLRLAHQRLRALDAGDDVKAALATRLIAITNSAKHDLRTASDRLERLVAELDGDDAPPKSHT